MRERYEGSLWGETESDGAGSATMSVTRQKSRDALAWNLLNVRACMDLNSS
jgi:hypothetical protein